MVLIKILTFSLSFFFLKLSPNILFDLVLEKKQPFVDDKNDIRRKAKILHFPKGLSYGFRQNFQILSQFVFLYNKPKYTLSLSSREKTTLSRP